VSYDVRRQDRAYEISRNGAMEDVQFDPAGVLETLYRRVQRDSLAAWPDAALLRAVTGRSRGERFLLVGETLRDRSRLALQLLSYGVDIEGDDLALLQDGVVTAYPRPLRVCGVDAPLPPLAPSLDELPFVGGSPRTGSCALDLALAGIEWSITTGSPDTVVAFDANYGGQTRVSELASHEMARILMSSCDPLSRPSHAIRAVARMANDARCYHLWLGALKDVGHFWPAQLP
jgi:hypothetical protein